GGIDQVPWAELLGDTSYRLTLIALDGRVISDSRQTQADGAGLENHLYRPEVAAALSGEPLTVRRTSRSYGERQLYTALPIYSPEGEITGVFRLSLFVPSFWVRIIPGALPFLLIALSLAAAAAWLVYVFSRNLASPISRLAAIAAVASTASTDSPDPEKLPYPAVSDIRELHELDSALRSMTAELRRRIEKAEAQGLRLEAILNNMTEAVFAIDAKLRIQLANPAACRLFDITDAKTSQDFGSAQAVHNAPSLLEATRSSALEEYAQRVLGAQKVLDSQSLLERVGESEVSTVSESELTLHQNGGTKYFQVFAAPLPGQGLVMVLSDVTRIRRLERVRKDFVANVSHELRTPIQLVKGFSENLLETDFSDLDQTRRFLEIISRNARRMEDLTADLLLLMNLESGESPALVMEAVPLLDLLSEAAGIVQCAASKKGIALSISCPEDLIVTVNSSFLIQGIFNLLDNAVKYSPADTAIELRAEKTESEVIIEVADQGPGIPSEHLERIFERFYRVDRSRSREAGGTGLGLSIVRHIALLHGGSVEVKSAVGGGAVFRVRIPGTGSKD
ncbi:MAG: PAS domain-containing protein, partial [Spirochaetaceae bacterium]|nr:PAS domain-containing protein [Spirochaetaceae bacterium]